jgi:regulator of nonsense transcripts 2
VQEPTVGPAYLPRRNSDLLFLQDEERAPSPDQVVVLSAPENLGPSEDAEAEFAKELAKMVTDSSTESRKVDKKTALALWDSAVLPPGVRKKRGEENGDERSTTEHNSQEPGQNIMNFTVITKRGNKQNVGFSFPITSAYP